jgi:hypothetical protein
MLRSTFCSDLDPTQCTSSCTSAVEAPQFLTWLKDTCPKHVQAGAYNLGPWINATVVGDEGWIPSLFPWKWTVQKSLIDETPGTFGIQTTDPLTSSTPSHAASLSGSGSCDSSARKKLAVYGVVNLLTALLLPIIGRRTIVQKATFGFCGNIGSRTWPLMGALSACLNICANLINAYVIRKTPGYERVPIGGLVLLWCTRPRLAWMSLFLAMVQPEDGMYLGSAASAITSEAILQAFASVYFILTVKYGSEKQFYLIGHLDPYPRGVSAHIMYAGALLWTIQLVSTLFACFVAVTGVNKMISYIRGMVNGAQGVTGAGAASRSQRRESMKKWIKSNLALELPGDKPNQVLPRNRNPPKPDDLSSLEVQISVILTAMLIAYLAQWLFWAGFVKAAQERYECEMPIWTLS